eukprot:COSAG03_NODE_7540_length_903_cov_1.569652_1_plen_187_part_00
MCFWGASCRTTPSRRRRCEERASRPTITPPRVQEVVHPPILLIIIVIILLIRINSYKYAARLIVINTQPDCKCEGLRSFFPREIVGPEPACRRGDSRFGTGTEMRLGFDSCLATQHSAAPDSVAKCSKVAPEAFRSARRDSSARRRDCCVSSCFWPITGRSHTAHRRHHTCVTPQRRQRLLRAGGR